MAECLTTLKTAFSKKIPSSDAHHISFASALNAWSHILSIAEDSMVCEQIQKYVFLFSNALRETS